MKFRTWLTAGVIAAGLSGVSMADVTGTIKFEGTAPKPKPINMSGVPQCAQQHKTPVLDESYVIKDGKLANVVVSLKEAPAGGKMPAEPAVLDQKGCQYTPHVVAMMVGQKMIVKNSDPFLHNVHGLPENNPGFNFGQNNIDPGKPIPAMKEAEIFRTKCDVHPWMSAWIAVFEHPYFAVSKEDGTFAIKGVPDGEYEILAWHERLGEQEGTVTVKGGKGEVNFSFKPEEASAEPAAVEAVVKAVSLPAGEACGDGKACCAGEKAAVAATK